MFKSVTFEITGQEKLHCEGCEQRVERLLNAFAGVRMAKAKASNQTVEVLYDAAKVEPSAIAERLGKAGYETRVTGSSSGPAA